MTKVNPAYGIPDEVVEGLERPAGMFGAQQEPTHDLGWGRAATYKYRNADKWREYMRLYMRKYRARGGS